MTLHAIFRDDGSVGYSTLPHTSDNPDEQTVEAIEDAHVVRLSFDPDPDDGLFAWMDQWLLNWSPWDLTPFENDVPVDKETHYFAEWWFDFENDPDTFLDHLVTDFGHITELTTRVDWARVLYQEYDAEASDALFDWDEVRDHGDVPDWIESID